MDPGAAEELYVRTWAEPSLDVNGVEGGSPQLQKTVIPVNAEANLSIRLAAGQTIAALDGPAEAMMRRWISKTPALAFPCLDPGEGFSLAPRL